MSDKDLLALLEQSRNRNKRQNVTGMLLHVEGNFLQVLEGKKNDVEEIYEAIVKDERNCGNIMLLKENINERTFPKWSMGFKHITSQNKDSLEGYSEFLERAMKPEEFTSKTDKVVRLLYHFKECNI